MLLPAFRATRLYRFQLLFIGAERDFARSSTSLFLHFTPSVAREVVVQDTLEEAGDEAVGLHRIKTAKRREGFCLVFDGTAGLEEDIDPASTFRVSGRAAESAVHKTLGVMEDAQRAIVIHLLAFLGSGFTPAVGVGIPPEIFDEKVFEDKIL